MNGKNRFFYLKRTGNTFIKQLQARSCEKIYANFAKYFFKTKDKIKCFIVLKCACLGLHKSISKFIVRKENVYNISYKPWSMCTVLWVPSVFYVICVLCVIYVL